MNVFNCPSLRVFLVSLAPLALACACASHPKEPVKLAGHWQRDPAASDDARAILADAFASAKERGAGGGGGKRGMGGGMGGGRGGMGGGRGGMGGGGMGGGGQRGTAAQGSGGRSNPEQLHQQLDRFVLPPQRLDVEQTAQDIHMTYDTDRQTRTLTPGTKSTIIDDHGSAEIEPKWKGNMLTVHTTVGSRLSVDEEYALSKDGGELVETLKLSGGSIKAVTIKSTYRRVP
jgi:hypothetical protein